MKQPDRITPAEAMRRINAHEKLVFVDVRTEEEWSSSDELIGAAMRVPPDEVEKHAARIPGNPLVLYCTTAHEATSMQVARELLSRGFREVRVLEGGLEGWKASKGFVAHKTLEERRREKKRHVEAQATPRAVERSENFPREGVGSGHVVETPMSSPPSAHRKQPDQPGGLSRAQPVEVEHERPSRHSHA